MHIAYSLYKHSLEELVMVIFFFHNRLQYSTSYLASFLVFLLKVFCQCLSQTETMVLVALLY